MKKNILKDLSFVLSAAEFAQLPADMGYEIVFAGRSNAGKSSVLNTLTRRDIARVSKTPGRTQQMNVFKLDDTRRILDLPGYGYAKVPENIKKQWERTLENYFAERQSLSGIFLIMDIRHPLKPFDMMMIEWAVDAKIPLHILLNKEDKLTTQEKRISIDNVKNFIKPFHEVSVQLFSALKNTGIEECSKKIETWLNI